MGGRSWSVAAVAVAIWGCGGSPPARWAEGGARLDIPVARWTGGGSTVDIAADGSVRVGEERVFTIDREGRVRDADGDPYALLDRDGRMVGPGDTRIGRLQGGTAEAADGSIAVAVSPTGEVVRRRDDATHTVGVWQGTCGQSLATLRACALVSYVVTVEGDRMAKRREQAEYRKTRTRSTR